MTYKDPNKPKTSYQRTFERQRLAALRAYGGDPPRCACCGEDNIEFLALDHIDGGGNDDRRKRKNTRLASQLMREGFPPGYRVLCHNCNMSMHFYGYCPHTKEGLTSVGEKESSRGKNDDR